MRAVGNRNRIVTAAAAGSASARRRPHLHTEHARRLRRLSRAFWASMLGFALVLPLSGIAFYYAERGHNDGITDLRSGLKWSAITILQDQAPTDAHTVVGTIILYFELFSCLVLVAIVITAAAGRLIEIINRHDVERVKRSMEGHIVICGWNSKGPEILRELHAKEVEDTRPVVILAPRDVHTNDPLVTLVRGNPNDEGDLIRAGLDRADTAIVLADDSNPNLEPDDIDGRTLLTALAIEHLQPKVYTCVEVLRTTNRRHFELTNADELVVSSDLSGALLASSAVHHGLSRVVTDLLTHPHGNEFGCMRLPVRLVGTSFGDAMLELKNADDCILLGVATGDATYDVNPPADRPLLEGDRLLVISERPVVDP
jgi:voltage-gated potassium channel